MKTTLATNLSKARKACKLTQTATARELGVKVRTYRAYEEGRATPSPQLLVRICRLYKVLDIAAFVEEIEFC